MKKDANNVSIHDRLYRENQQVLEKYAAYEKIRDDRESEKLVSCSFHPNTSISSSKFMG